MLLNSIRLNSVSLNIVGSGAKKRGSGGGGGGSDVPDGYEVFMTNDGPFLAADGEFYVKL